MALNTELQRYLEMATGLTQVTKNKAESVVRGLVKQGEIAGDKAEKAVDDLLSRSERNRSAMTKLVRTETQKAVEKLGLVPKRELDKVREKVERLEQQLRATSAGSAAPSGAAKKASKAAAAKKQVAKATKKSTSAQAAPSGSGAEAPAKNASAKKATAKKSATKKATAKKASTTDARATAAASTAKKASAKKGVGKKASAKKATTDARSTAAASTAEAAERSAPPAAQPGDGDT